MFDLTNRRVLVVGASGYLGSDVCRGLLEQGATVLATDINGDKVSELARELSQKKTEGICEPFELDICDESAVHSFIADIKQNYGGLDALVNLAYRPHSKAVDLLTSEDFNLALETNVIKAFILAREAKAIMQTGSSIVFFGSMYGSISPDPGMYEPPMQPNAIEYGVSKAGVQQMVRYLAVAWAADGIRVNTVSPGTFPYPSMHEEYPDFIERLADKTPMKRVGRQHEVTGAVVFLVSDESSYVVGHNLAVDGGWTIW